MQPREGEPKMEERESEVDGFLRDFREDYNQLGKDEWEAQWGEGHDEAQASSNMFEARRLYEIKINRTWEVVKSDALKNEIAKRLVKDGNMEIAGDLLENNCFDGLDEKVKEEVLDGLANYHYERLRYAFKAGSSNFENWIWVEIPRAVRGKVMLKLANGDEQEKEFFEWAANNEIVL